MANLREIVEILKNEQAKAQKKKHPYSKLVIKRIIKKYDATLLEKRANWAIDDRDSKEKRRATPEDIEIRKNNPGLFDVVFLNRHSGERRVLTAEKGTFYDRALNYYNFITYYGSEKYNDLGKYEIERHRGLFIPAESHIGL